MNVYDSSTHVRPSVVYDASTRKSLSRLAWFLDSSIPIPGLGFRIGADGLIGLIPGVGDAVGAALSSYILAQAARLGVPKSVILRMGFNVLLETLIGLIPFVGDIFDFAWKANLRNVELLNEYMDNPRQTSASSGVLVGAITVVLIALVILIMIGGFMILGALWTAITQ